MIFGQTAVAMTTAQCSVDILQYDIFVVSKQKRLTIEILKIPIQLVG